MLLRILIIYHPVPSPHPSPCLRFPLCMYVGGGESGEARLPTGSGSGNGDKISVFLLLIDTKNNLVAYL